MIMSVCSLSDLHVMEFDGTVTLTQVLLLLLLVLLIVRQWLEQTAVVGVELRQMTAPH